MPQIQNRDDVAPQRDRYGAEARIFTAEGHKLTVAEVRLEPGTATSVHKHKRTEEIYFVTSGAGRMRLDEEVREVTVGDCVVIIPWVLHEIRNESDEPLVFIAACAPAVDPADFYAADGTPMALQLDGP